MAVLDLLLPDCTAPVGNLSEFSDSLSRKPVEQTCRHHTPRYRMSTRASLTVLGYSGIKEGRSYYAPAASNVGACLPGT